jgi:hypothetical protein
VIPNLALIRADIEFSLRKLRKTVGKRIRKDNSKLPVIKSRVPVSKIKGFMRNSGLALDENGKATWFYTAYYREDSDPLTNETMEFICSEIPKDASLLITGCGTGIMLFYLMDRGFKDVEGFDYLEKCVLVANKVAEAGGYTTRIWQDDGFNPSLQKKYHLITAMHWVFSAWMGNYGNDALALSEAKSPETRERLLVDFLSRYSPHLHTGGLLIIELIDAVADYRSPLDYGWVRPIPLSDIYPVRHTPAQVSTCAKQCGLEVVSYSLSVTYGHQPRTSYQLRKL